MADVANTAGGPAPAAPSTPAAGGGASAGAGTSGVGAGASSPAPATNFAGALAANGAAGGQAAGGQGGQAGSSGVAALSQTPPQGQGQTAIPGQGQSQPTAPQTPATLESLVASHPHLAQQIAQMQSWAMYGQQGYQQQQLARGQQAAPQPPGQAQPPAKKSVFGLPEFDPSMKQFLTVDAEGNVVPKPGAPPYAAAQYAAYQQAKVQAAEQFFDDPEKYLGDMIDRRARQIATEAAGGQLQGAQQQAQAQQFVAANRQWIYELDAQGQVARNWDGAVKFKPLGQLLATKIEYAKSKLNLGPSDQIEYAMAFVQAAHGQQAGQQQGATQQQQADAARGNFLLQAQQAAAQGGAAAPPQPPAAQPTTPGGPLESATSRFQRAAESAGLNLHAPAAA